MGRNVYEIMSSQLVAISPERPAKTVADEIVRLGITAVPVVDRSGYPLGMLSLRDLAGPLGEATAGDLMRAPAVVIEASASTEAAARVMASSGLHRLVVVDDMGRSVGVVSTLDVIRALCRLPVTHPWPFPFREHGGKLEWSEEHPLEKDRIWDVVPTGPGVFVLMRGGKGVPETVVWSESSENARERLIELFGAPQPEPLKSLLARGDLRFRVVSTPRRAARDEALRTRGATHR